ncbi:hypothetical protein [Archangium lansingense]|uniref:Lipoprotein n=1 Tax=Archangium lansingense TaxID=2995310 RepID=A0ABT3ZXY7_9BACT|nr:hypothetical protein [Archangium lansinium]MCY1073614.1 hypothetical protein [Archangium lansinium]
MNSQSLFRVLTAAGLSLAVTACGPQDELSSNEPNPAAETASVTSRVSSPRLSPDEASAVAAGSSDEDGSVQVLGITYVRPHGVRPALLAYEVLVTTYDRDGLTLEELVYVDANDGSVLLRIPRNSVASESILGE